MRTSRTRKASDRETEFALVHAAIVEESSVRTGFGRTPIVASIIGGVLLALAALGAWSNVMESRAPLEGTVVAKFHVPPRRSVVIYSVKGGPRTETHPGRYVLHVRTRGDSRLLVYDVPAPFWEEVKPNDRVRRENGKWRLDLEPGPTTR